MRRKCPLGALVGMLAVETLAAAGRIGEGALAVEVSDHGLILGVPSEGIHTVDGPRVELAPGVAEWFAVAYEAPTGRRELVGRGAAPDWAGRESVEALSRTADGAITRGGDLEIATRYSISGTAPYLISRVTLTNRGTAPLHDLVYSREWRGPSGEGWTFPDDVPGLRPAPDGVRRRVWRLGSLPAGGSTGLTLSFEPGTSPRPTGLSLEEPSREEGSDIGSSSPAAPDVPLSLWTSGQYPQGVPIGETMGISWGDYDADGHIDLFACKSANLWRNVSGTTWELAADLDVYMPPTERRYGSSFGDYDRDGLPDIATEPRVPVWGDDTMHLLKNLGGGPNFVDVAGDPAIVDVQPYNNGETFCWADVDGDRNLDLFAPFYPASVSGPGNFFLYNLGPTGPGGAYRFTEMSAVAGLDNPPGSARPEGAQTVDVDFDGDVDLYSNGTLYRNVSTRSDPKFEAMSESASGIGLSGSRDEGAMFFDYDLDADPDLFVAYTADGVRIWENRGDGTFFGAESSIIEDPFVGLNLGMSAEDWDNDGDVDFTTRQVFRRNLLVEQGTRRFRLATHSIPSDHLTSATPAWGDWDRDGDLDCALGNWGSVGHFYENTLYGPQTPEFLRRYVRVRALANRPGAQGGLETEYGAAAELRIEGEPEETRRWKFVASSHGYLNQNEYTLHFGLPPAPGGQDLSFRLAVDFPGLPTDGLWRVDEHVNPVLGDLELAALGDREIEVYRCGQVAIGGVVHDPLPLASLTLATTTGGLAQPTATLPLPPPTPSPGPDAYVGLVLDTQSGTTRLAVKEILLDGQLDDAVSCGTESSNLALWDVTNPASPILVPASLLARSTSPRNHRSRFPVHMVLEPGRSYRLVARVREYRTTSIQAPISEGALTVLGGMYFADAAPCTGLQVASASVDPSATSLAVRFAPLPSSSDPDPVGDSLRLDRDPAGRPVLDWQDVGAPAHRILRCSAASGPCVPDVRIGTTPDVVYTDADVTSEPGEQFWYLVEAMNACTADL